MHTHDLSTYTVVTLRPCNWGRRNRHISLTRPEKIRTKRAKRQGNPMGNRPDLRTS